MLLADHQHRVMGGDHDHVIHPDHGRQMVVRADVHVAGAHDHALAAHRVAVSVAIRQLPDRRPVPHIRPADIGRDDGCPRGLFHHGIIDRLSGRAIEAVGIEQREVEVDLGPGDGLRRGLDHLGLEGAQLVLHDVGAKKEITGVPEVALGAIALGRGRVGFLDEAVDGEHLMPLNDGAAGLDVAVARRGMVGPDAERHDMALRRRDGRLAAQRDEAGTILDHVVGRQNRHDGVGRDARGKFRGNRHGWPGVAADRLQHDLRGAVHLEQLLTDEKTIGVVRHHDRRLEDRVAEDLHRHLERRTRPDQRNELFRQAFAGFRPHACSGTAAHDHGKNFHQSLSMPAKAVIRGFRMKISSTKQAPQLLPGPMNARHATSKPILRPRAGPMRPLKRVPSGSP